MTIVGLDRVRTALRRIPNFGCRRGKHSDVSISQAKGRSLERYVSARVIASAVTLFLSIIYPIQEENKNVGQYSQNR